MNIFLRTLGSIIVLAMFGTLAAAFWFGEYGAFSGHCSGWEDAAVIFVMGFGALGAGAVFSFAIWVLP